MSESKTIREWLDDGLLIPDNHETADSRAPETTQPDVADISDISAGDGIRGDIIPSGAAGGGIISGDNAPGGDLPAGRQKELLRKKDKGKTRRIGRRKSRKRWVVVTLLIIVAAALWLYSSAANSGIAVQQVRYADINRGDLRNVVSVKGNVQSEVKRNVYSTLTLMVKSVEVSVGDAVSEGQILCTLDKEDLELNIEQQNAELNASKESSDKQIESSERIYNEAAENLRSGSNAQILSAEAAVRNAQVSLETAQANYNNLMYDYNNGTNASRLSAESALNSARTDLENRERDYENNKILFAAGAITQETLIQMENAFNAAQTRFDDAITSLENAKTAEARALEQSGNSLRSAQTAYNNALNSLSSAQNAAEQELARYESNVETSKAGANIESRQIALKKLEKQLVDSEIRSPVDGVVTAVYAKEGSSGSGLLFVIEDPNSLTISIKIKEYDTGKLIPGMPVVIKSDAIADVEYAGTLKKIDPAAVKNAIGETDTISDIEFGAEVSVDSANTSLRIGMNARLDIIIEQRDNVYYVPFDALAENEAGETTVFVIENTETGGAAAREIPVSVGLETDFYVEISGQALTDGMVVINEPSEYNLYDGMPVAYQDAAGAAGRGIANRFGMRIG